MEAHDIPVVFLSCHIEPEIVERTERITSYGYIVKTCSETVLLASIKMAFRLHRAHTDRMKSETKFRSLIENTRDWVWEINAEGTYTYVSPNTTDITGYTPEELHGTTPFDYMDPGEAHRVKRLFAAIAENQEHIIGFEDILIDKSGKPKIFATNATPVFDENNSFQGYFGTCRDITERTRAEEERKLNEARLEALLHLQEKGHTDKDEPARYALEESERLTQSEMQKNIILNATTEMVAYYDSDLRVIWSNRASAEPLGKTTEELVGKHCYEIWQQRNTPCPDCPVLKARDEKTPHKAEQQTPDGRFWSLRGYPVMDNAGNVTALVEFGQDITDRKQTEIQLQKSIEDKDFLMKELNHRVKNNLAMIASLVNLKNTALEGTVDLTDIIHQIDAIRIVHEKLFQSDQIADIEVRDYFQELLTTVFSSFAAIPVIIENKIDTVSLSTKLAIPLGLIVNEVATNAIKYGFTERAARFTIDLEKDSSGDGYILVLSNSGRPFPDDIDFEHPDTLGLRLISALVAQLDGEIELQRRPHPVFTIHFPG